MKKTIALFDFDGTVTLSDSTITFYKYLYKSKLNFLFNNYVLCFWYIFLYKLKITNYLPLKNYRLSVHTSKFDNLTLQNLSNSFYSKCFLKLINPLAKDRIDWHKKQGHEVWVISASYDFLLEQWSIDNEINLITNSTIVIDSKRCIAGKDVNYDAKVEYLLYKINLEDYSDIYAYGDSEGDMAMLNIANFKYYKPFR